MTMILRLAALPFLGWAALIMVRSALPLIYDRHPAAIAHLAAAVTVAVPGFLLWGCGDMWARWQRQRRQDLLEKAALKLITPPR